MFPFASQNKNSLTINVVLAAIAAFSIIYLAPKILSIGVEEGIDFRSIWLAGKFWAASQNPYGSLYQNEYAEISQIAGRQFFYPPNLFPLAVPFSLFSLSTGTYLWKLFNFGLLIGATYLIARALADVGSRKLAPIFLSGLGFVCFMQATASTLFIGQTSILVYFGFAAIIFGLLKARPTMLVIGLAFLALKPHIGVVAFCAVAALKHYRWTVLPAAGVSLAATTPIFFIGDYRAQIEGFLGNLLRYNAEWVPNFPVNQIGFINLLRRLVPDTIATACIPILVLAAIICAIIVFRYSSLGTTTESKNEPKGSHERVASLALFVASTFFLVPLHFYDIVSLVTLWMMIVAVPLPGRWVTGFCLLICLRPANLWGLLGFTRSANLLFPESGLVSFALLFLFLTGVLARLAAQGGATRPS